MHAHTYTHTHTHAHTPNHRKGGTDKERKQETETREIDKQREGERQRHTRVKTQCLSLHEGVCVHACITAWRTYFLRCRPISCACPHHHQDHHSPLSLSGKPDKSIWRKFNQKGQTSPSPQKQQHIKKKNKKKNATGFINKSCSTCHFSRRFA